MIVTGLSVVRWLEERTGKPAVPPCEAVGVERDGEIVGAVLFNNFTGHDVHVTVAGEPRAWTRGVLRHLADYAYRQLGCTRVTIITEQPAVLDLALRLGGRVEGRLRDQFGPGRTAALIGITAGDWRV